MNNPSLVVPVILSGGSGTRLWPASLPERPKQFLPLTANETMLQLTAQRSRLFEGFGPPVIVANAAHADIIEDQLTAIGIDQATLVLEPLARNTAPAIALAALAASDPEAPLLIMPSDHVIADLAAFREAIDRAMPLVRDGWLATFGITPDGPETGYGYIRVGESLAPGAFGVDAFVEKPDLDKAIAMLAQGNHAWNAGIFMFRADAYLDALRRFHPAMVEAAEAAIERAVVQGSRIFPDREAFSASPSDSIDYAVMERAERVACIPVAMGWSDVGSWDALHGISGKDEAGNAFRGEILAIDTQNCFVRTDGRRVALVGVKDLIVIAEGDEILILPSGQSQHVRKVTERLKGK